MADRVFNIDDPQNVNSFLALINQPHGPSSVEQSEAIAPVLSSAANPLEAETAGNHLPVRLQPSVTFVFQTSSKTKQEEHSDDPNSRSESVSASPAKGTKAPPPTPATGAVASNAAVASLEPIEEDGSDVLRTIANSSNLSLNDSIYAPKNYKGSRIATANTKYATMPARRAPVMSVSNSFAPADEDQTEESHSKKSEQEELITKYQDEVIAKFVRDKSPEDEMKSKARSEPKTESEPERFPTFDNLHTNSTVPVATDKVTQSTVDTPDTIEASTSNPKMTVNTVSENGKDDIDGRDEDRENLKHFSSWGTPTPRSRPTARVRKIILSNLPANSDLTLVQSLVYGGVIDTFSLGPSKTSAYVTFVSADACDAYSNAHPNGLVFRNPKNRRNHIVYVDKGQDVDVVSGVLQAYLDCEASRVVRATGADEDWGMRALYKLAESKNRKVETIVDTYRDQIRTIIFRFTNIFDAVTFRGQLLRDEDWEMCNIQFMDDPVEKATGVHLEE